jgi:peroxiredoxin/TolA-binding protein
MVVIAAVAITLGAGIWRRSTQAKTAELPAAPVAASEPGTPPAPAPVNALGTPSSPATVNAPGTAPAPVNAPGTAPATANTPGAAPAPTHAPGAAPAAGAPGGAAAEFQALVESFGAKIKTATDRRAFAQELETSLQQFIERYPQERVTDQARITLGKLQMTLGQPVAAIETFRQMAEHPTDGRLASPARFYMAQAQVASGQIDAARQTLSGLARSAESEKLRKAAQQVLDQMAAQKEAENAVAVGKTAPPIRGTDLTGQSQSLDRYRGKVLLIDFWATWCGPCRAELPNVKAIYRKYKDRGFAVLGISLDQDRAALKSFLKEEQMEWPQLFDGKGWRNEIAQRYGVTAVPHTVLLDRQGVIRYVDTRGQALEGAVEELLGSPAG